MKTKHLYITALLLLGLSVPAHPQSEPGGFDGLQNSLNEWMDGAAESNGSLKQMYDEFIRVGWLFDSDIRMRMNAEFAESDYEQGLGYLQLAYFHTSEREASLYAEFDWQNMAESIRAKSSEYKTSVKILSISDTIKHSDEDFTMYIDKQGYWYVPSDDGPYMRVKMSNHMQNQVDLLEIGIEAAIEANVGEMLEQLIASSLMTLPRSYLSEIFPLGFEYNFDGSTVDAQLTQLLEDLARARFDQVAGFPVFIHFAFIISPTLARSQFDVQEETITWLGQDNCIKMTVLSGKDRGYQVVFDRYGRLVHLRDTDGGTADYWYDRDVTVNIPSAVSPF